MTIGDIILIIVVLFLLFTPFGWVVLGMVCFVIVEMFSVADRRVRCWLASKRKRPPA